MTFLLPLNFFRLIMNFIFKRNRYSISSNLIFGTFVLGIANLFLDDPGSLIDFAIMAGILLLRYLAYVLIKRRFQLSSYLLIILAFRSIYRLLYITDNTSINSIAKINIVIQAIFSFAAFFILIVGPKILKRYSDRKIEKLNMQSAAK